MPKNITKIDNTVNIYKLIRIARNVQVKELAEELRVTTAYINAIEKGTRVPPQRLIRDYSEALNVSEDIIKQFDYHNGKNSSFEKMLLWLLQRIVQSDEEKNVGKSNI